MLRSDDQQEARVIGRAVYLLFFRASTLRSKKSKEKQTEATQGFLLFTFYFSSIKFIPEIVKAEEFSTYYAALFIFHILPVLMGLIPVSAMITPRLASITGAWLSSRAKSSFPYTQPPHYGATEIHSLLTVKSHAAGFQMLHTHTEANHHPSAPPAAVKSWFF